MLTRSYVHGASEKPLIGETIGVHLGRIAERYAERPALVVRHQDVRWRYAEFKNEVDALAAGFVALGLKPGDRIGIWSQNNVEWVLTQFATAKAGLVLVNINPAYRAYELEYALRQSECQTLLLIQGFRDCDYISTLVSICPEVEHSRAGELSSEKLPHLRNLIFVGDGGTARHVPLERPRGNGPTCSGAGLENKGGIARLR